ncbi:hypothetical protein BDN70DRAFT_932960 [Pholiota conissans]|uniref:Uncharacterized protein n=1 Tax=Pholiota conissans TaxID=109636 RepID=A0A9P6D029_9AGAR|nr:hypothetical protein BDN70DRAFT_932960 [Pholiota conissans]
MFPTVARLSKASRAPLTPKRGNKDFYKGTRQAFLPGGPRTGAPGRHVIRGRAKYQLLDEKVRVYVAPVIEDIEETELKPYVVIGTRLSEDHKKAVWSNINGPGGITPERFLRVAREQAYAEQHPEQPVPSGKPIPGWMQAQINLKLREDPIYMAMPFTKYRRDELALNAKKDRVVKGPRQLEIVDEKPSSSSPS